MFISPMTNKIVSSNVILYFSVCHFEWVVAKLIGRAFFFILGLKVYSVTITYCWFVFLCQRDICRPDCMMIDLEPYLVHG